MIKLSRVIRPVAAVLPPALRDTLKRNWKRLLFQYEGTFAPVDASELRRVLRELGVQSGDLLFVHSSFDQMQSIRATPVEMIEMLCEAVGASGTVVMPTFPMSGTTSQEYLDQNPVFHWRRTPSRVGMLTEIFRRMPGTERSLHPTHPIAARGAAAAWLTEGHERSETPFDEHSPFQKLLERNALVLRMGRFEAMTFRHLADHLIRDRIAQPIYASGTTQVRATGKDGKEHIIATQAHNPNIESNHEVVLDRMAREGSLRTARAGRVVFSVVELKPYIDCYHRCQAEGVLRHYPKAHNRLAEKPGLHATQKDRSGE
jgi:aminoglycoside 3-N-acetyltransferase